MTGVPEFRPYNGKHCESTATGNLLRHIGVELSEPMMVGLGEAFGFIYWKMEIMNLPFLGGRSRQFELTRTLCERLGLQLDARETGSTATAWKNLAEAIDGGSPVGLQLDFYYLDYIHEAIHFPGHFLCAYAYDAQKVWVIDTDLPPENLTVGRANLEHARFEKGPMAAKARSWTIQGRANLAALREVIPQSIRNVATQFLNPPIRNFGYKGIQKLSEEVVTWLDIAPDPSHDLSETASVMEGGGTGGALFRNFYRDFLQECLGYFPGNAALGKARDLYATAAENWTAIAESIADAGKSAQRSHLERAADLCRATAELEQEAMAPLAVFAG